MNTLLRLLFHLAATKNCRKNDVEIVLEMIKKTKGIFASIKSEFGIELPLNFSLDQFDENKMSPPMYAAQQVNLPIVKYFFEDLKEEQPFSEKSLDGALYYAAESGRKDEVDYLLEKGAKVLLLLPGVDYDFVRGFDSALGAAVLSGHVAIIDTLAEVLHKKEKGVIYFLAYKRALLNAIEINSAFLVIRLLENLYSTSRGKPPVFCESLLPMAIKHAGANVINLLLESDKLNGIFDGFRNKFTRLATLREYFPIPLEIAIREKKLVAVYLLLKHEAEWFKKDDANVFPGQYEKQLELISIEKIFIDILSLQKSDEVLLKIFCLLLLKGGWVSKEFIYSLVNLMSNQREDVLPYLIISIFSDAELMTLLDSDKRDEISIAFLVLRGCRTDIFMQLLRTQGFSITEQIAMLTFAIARQKVNKAVEHAYWGYDFVAATLLKDAEEQQLIRFKQELTTPPAGEGEIGSYSKLRGSIRSEGNNRCHAAKLVGLTRDSVTDSLAVVGDHSYLDSYYDRYAYQENIPVPRTPVAKTPTFSSSSATNSFLELLLQTITELSEEKFIQLFKKLKSEMQTGRCFLDFSLLTTRYKLKLRNEWYFDINYVNAAGENLLSLAIKLKKNRLVNFLLDEGANRHVAYSGGNTPLLIATREHNQEGVALLVTDKTVLSAVNDKKENCLIIAAQVDDIRLIEFFRDHKLSLNQDNIHELLWHSAKHNALSVIQHLDGTQAVNYKWQFSGIMQGGLSHASVDSDLPIFEFFLMRRVPFSIKNLDSVTVLDLLTWRVYSSLLDEKLIDKRADSIQRANSEETSIIKRGAEISSEEKIKKAREYIDQDQHQTLYRLLQRLNLLFIYEDHANRLTPISEKTKNRLYANRHYMGAALDKMSEEMREKDQSDFSVKILDKVDHFSLGQILNYHATFSFFGWFFKSETYKKIRERIDSRRTSEKETDSSSLERKNDTFYQYEVEAIPAEELESDSDTSYSSGYESSSAKR